MQDSPENWAQAAQQFQLALGESWGKALQAFQGIDLVPDGLPATDTKHPKLAFEPDKLQALQQEYLKSAA
jgi:polyhydroxyalkanoate synthase